MRVAEVGTRDGSCPYCGIVFQKVPARAMVCSSCRKTVRVRNRKREDGKRLLTEVQALFLDRLRGGELTPELFTYDVAAVASGAASLPHLDPALHAEADRRIEGQWRELTLELGRGATLGDLLWRIHHLRLADALAGGDWLAYGFERFRLAQQAFVEGRYSLASRMMLEAVYIDVTASVQMAELIQSGGFHSTMSAWLKGERSPPSAWVGLLVDAVLPGYESLDRLRGEFAEATAQYRKAQGFPDPDHVWPVIVRAMSGSLADSE